MFRTNQIKTNTNGVSPARDELAFFNKIHSPDAVPTKNSFFPAPLIQAKLSINPPGDAFESEADAVADQVMRMPEPVTGATGQVPVSMTLQRKCSDCAQEDENVQRRTDDQNTGTRDNSAPGIVQEELSRPGQALDVQTQTFMENRFGRDFSNVRLHKDGNAANSAASIQALAYTSGNNIVFGQGQYRPETQEGKRLLAHELTHVIQQQGRTGSVQRRCPPEETTPSATMPACPEGSQDVGRQAQSQSNAIDARAEAIITRAQDAAVSLRDRALRVVSDIICAYMPSQAGKVRRLYYVTGHSGLETQSVGSGASTQGDICVGDYFVNNTTRGHLARRALQVAHELQHIDQYRSGITGANRSNEREFLAFYDEALADEFIGTRRMPDATRRSLIDGAIGYYYCLDATLQTQYASRLQDLLTRRQTVNGTSGNPSTNPPTTCRRA